MSPPLWNIIKPLIYVDSGELTAPGDGGEVFILGLWSFKNLLHEVLLLGGQWRIARGVSADWDPCALCTSGSCWHRL